MFLSTSININAIEGFNFLGKILSILIYYIIYFILFILYNFWNIKAIPGEQLSINLTCLFDIDEDYNLDILK